MKLINVKTDHNIVSSDSGTTVLFSGERPVMAYIPGRGYILSEEWHRDIVDVVSSEELESLVELHG